MDFYELAAQLLMSAQGQGDGPVPAVYGQPSIEEGEAAAAYLENLCFIKNKVNCRQDSWFGFRFMAFLTPKGKELIIGHSRRDVDRIANHLRQQHNPLSQAIDQSTHIHGDNTGAIFSHSSMTDSQINVNSNNNTEIAELIKKIVQALKADSTLKAEERKEALIDAEQLKLETQRKKPDKSKMKKLWDKLQPVLIAIAPVIVDKVSGIFS